MTPFLRHAFASCLLCAGAASAAETWRYDAPGRIVAVGDVHGAHDTLVRTLGNVRDLAGPREESLPDMVRAYARATGQGRWVIGIPMPGETGRQQRDGSALPGPDADRGRQTYAEWVAALPHA